MIRQILGRLRSPRLAAGLMAYLVAYVAVLTVVPQRGALTDAEVDVWLAARPVLGGLVSMLGLDNAYWSPLFVLPAAVLLLSTAVCAGDRTASTARLVALTRAIPAPLARRVEASPQFTVASADGHLAMDRVASVARELKLRVVADEDGLRGTRRLWAAWGSPVFHWALVGLFVVAAVGQAVKWEGVVGIPVGHSVTDGVGSYGRIDRGPLGPAEPASGYTISVPEMAIGSVEDGVDLGHTPLVRLSEGQSVVAQGLVFPNSPLVHGGLYVHREQWGLAVVAALESTSGAEIGRRNFLIDIASTGGTGRLGIEEGMPPESGIARIRFAVPLDPAGDEFVADVPADPRVEVSVPGSATAPVKVMRAGDVVAFPDAELSLRVVDVTRYVRLLVVHDPTIPFVYVFFVIAALGAAVALLVQPRALVAVHRTTGDGELVADVVVLAKRVDPLFNATARDALQSLSSPEGDA
ncbi:MAG: cytochrome c biogenesis protein ResB [Coriobacteriia bacterium]|nr:cytochrome c biogenesis protein ResB [Coriobacteriia bacterium]